MNSEKAILVTGAGGGIGRASALKLQELGHSVILAGRRKSKLQETISMQSKTGGKLLAIPTDIADPISVKSLFSQLEREFRRLDRNPPEINCVLDTDLQRPYRLRSVSGWRCSECWYIVIYSFK